jgi:hypothetical protein
MYLYDALMDYNNHYGWYLTPLSTLFQLYLEYKKKTNKKQPLKCMHERKYRCSVQFKGQEIEASIRCFFFK